MTVINRFTLLFVCLLLFSCTASYTDLLTSANNMASAEGFDQQVVQGGRFQFQSYHKLTKLSHKATIYLEGDGKAWVTRYRTSLNPTPHNPQALKLALADTISENIIYLARPCQYRLTGQDSACSDAKYWTLSRYSQEVVSGLSAAIDQLQQQNQLTSLQLVGFSGGGALAVLLAAQRNDVVSLRTVAANLDIVEFSRWHKTTPLRGSLNPLDVAEKTATIAQQHFSGGKDKMVPWEQITRFRNKLNNKPCVEFIQVSEAAHHQGWSQRWPELLQRDFGC